MGEATSWWLSGAGNTKGRDTELPPGTPGSFSGPLTSPRSLSAQTSHHSPFSILVTVGKKCEQTDQGKMSEVKGHDPGSCPISSHAPESSLDSDRRERTQSEQACPPWRMRPPSDFFLFCAILILFLKRRNLDLLRHPVQSRPKLQEHAHQARFSTSWEEKPRLKLRVAPLAGGSPLTLTSCCGKGPREFSGTLMGGMTQSRFCRLSPLELWCCGHGSSVSFGGWTGSRAAFFFPFCRKGEKRQRSLVRFCRGKGIT